MREIVENKFRALPFLAVAAMLLAVSCASIDCPMNSLVYTQYQLRTPGGAVDTLADTLTISTTRTDGYDSVLINKNVATTEFSLPISYSQPEDVFFIETKDSVLKNSIFDTITVTKEDYPHFESVDCSPALFHTIAQTIRPTHPTPKANCTPKVFINFQECSSLYCRKVNMGSLFI